MNGGGDMYVYGDVYRGGDVNVYVNVYVYVNVDGDENGGRRTGSRSEWWNRRVSPTA